MALRRFDAHLPAAYDFPQVVAVTRARYQTAAAVNEVELDDGPVVAVYWDGWSPSAASLDAWRAEVAAHVPAHPTTAEQASTAAANADAIGQALDDAVARLAQIVTQQTTVAAAAKDATQAGQVGQLWAATQAQANALIDIATMLKRLRRLVRGDFTGTD